MLTPDDYAFPGGLFEPQHGGMNDREPWNPGMTLRDFFASQAMQQGMAILTSGGQNVNEYQIKNTARTAYLVADAMLLARKETP